MSYQLASRDVPPWSPEATTSSSDFAFRSIIGQSPAMKEAVNLARKVAERRLTTVLIVGETGTGKGLFSRGIHYASPDATEPFVAVNCATIPSALLESELFGHERGAFTGAQSRKQGLIELARGGTLLLDEVNELPPNLQPKLLRALEERRARRIGGLDEFEVRCRIIAATNASLEEAVAGGTFREDLFYRLNVLRVSIPPLRDRQGDIDVLARHFLDAIIEEQGLEPQALSLEALHVLRSHHWPGNVRELKNVIQRAALMCENGEVMPRHLTIYERHALYPRQGMDEYEPYAGQISIPPEGVAMSEIEAEALRITLQITGGNQSAAARILGISRPTLARKAREYGLRTNGRGRRR